jgi:hypothetical protein
LTSDRLPTVSSGSTPSGSAADQVLGNREAKQVVVGLADWHAGNTAVVDGALVGTFDWELVADTEAVIVAGIDFASSSTPARRPTLRVVRMIRRRR